VVMPVIAEKFTENKLEEIDLLYKKVAVNQLLLCLLLFIGIWVNIDSLYYFVPNKEVYEAGKWVVLLIGLGKLSDILFSVNGEIIVFSKYYVFNITATIIMSLIVIGLNLLLIPIYGIEGAALASLIAMVIYNLIKYYYIKFRFNFSPFTPALFKTLFIGLIVVAISELLIPRLDHVILDIAVRSTAVTLLYIAGVYFLKLAPDAEDLILKKFRK
jgi:O-antigen/teichoic acid export membrane protein